MSRHTTEYPQRREVWEAETVRAAERERLADAWDEGYDSGSEDARAVNAAWPERTTNPYALPKRVSPEKNDMNEQQQTADPFAGYGWEDDRGELVVPVRVAREVVAARLAAVEATYHMLGRKMGEAGGSTWTVDDWEDLADRVLSDLRAVVRADPPERT